MKLEIDNFRDRMVDFKGEYLSGTYYCVSDESKKEYPELHEGRDVGDITSVDISEVNIYAQDTDPISALEIFKEEVEELIKILKDKQNEK